MSYLIFQTQKIKGITTLTCKAQLYRKFQKQQF